MGSVESGASNIGGRADSQSITWEHSGGDGDLGAAVGLGSGVKRWATAEREQVERERPGAGRARKDNDRARTGPNMDRSREQVELKDQV